MVRVTLMPGMMEFRKSWKRRSSDLVPGKMPKISSRKREYKSG